MRPNHRCHVRLFMSKFAPRPLQRTVAMGSLFLYNKISKNSHKKLPAGLLEERVMKISEIATVLEAEILCGEEHLERKIISACGSDMMSDVLAFVKQDAILLTGLVNPQVIRTAEMMDIMTIAFVRGKKCGEDIIELAKERGMVLIRSPLTMYTACGRLYASGLRGEDHGT